MLYSAKKGQIILDIGESVAIGDQFTTFPVALQLCQACHNLLLHLTLVIGEWRECIGDILGQFYRLRRAAQDNVCINRVQGVTQCKTRYVNVLLVAEGDAFLNDVKLGII